MAEQSRTGSENVKEDVDALRADVEKLAQTIGKVAGDRADAAKNAGRRKLDDARRVGEDVSERALEQVRAQPLGSLLTAFVVGLLLGFLFDRRH